MGRFDCQVLSMALLYMNLCFECLNLNHCVYDIWFAVILEVCVCSPHESVTMSHQHFT